MLELIKKITAIPGISGRENLVRDFIIEQIKDYAEYQIDPLGNLLVFRKGRKPANHKVMIDAHMDEVGFIITDITSEGFLHFAKVGGINTAVLAGRRVKVGENGINGVFGIKPIHLVEKADERKLPSDDNLYIDIGAENREEALKYVQPGDSAWFSSETVEFGSGFLKAKALDDRVGCAILIKMIQNEPEYDLWFSFSVQEEIGLRGAKTAAFSIAPEYAIAVETTTAADISGVKGDKRVCILGNGGVVSFMDRSTIYSRELFDRAFEIAGEKNIPCQTKTMVAGGNNAGAIHQSRGGVKVLTVSVPCRYLHSPACVINFKDVESSLELINELAEDFAK